MPGIFPAMTVEKGMCFAFPDVCKTPTPGGPVPIPYPNMAMCPDGGSSKKTKIRKKKILRKGDKIRQSSGDEPGSIGGVKSSTIKGPAKVKTGYSKVKVEGADIGHLTVMTEQNGANANIPPGTHVVPSQTDVKVMGPPAMPATTADKESAIMECSDMKQAGVNEKPLESVADPNNPGFTKDGKPIATVMCGPPAAGKSTLRNRLMGENGPMKGREVIDADEIKDAVNSGKLSPADLDIIRGGEVVGARGVAQSVDATGNIVGHDGLPLTGRFDPKGFISPDPAIRDVGLDIHEASSAIAKSRFGRAAGSGRPFVYDITGGNKRKVLDNISELKAKGYHVHVAGSYADANTCADRNLKRARTVPDHVLRETHQKVTDNWEDIMKAADSAEKSTPSYKTG